MRGAGMVSRARVIAAGAAGGLLMSALLGVGPATAGEHSPATVGESRSYGEVLNTQSEAVPGGVLKITEFQDRTEVEGTIASCDVSGSASKPTLQSGRLTSKVKWNVQGCTNTVRLVHIIGETSSGHRLDLNRWEGTRKAPTHVVHGLTRSCTRGDIVSVLTISLDNYEYNYYESLPLRVTRC